VTELLLADADFVVQDADRVLRRASVWVVDDGIDDVGDAAELARRHPAAERRDCRGLILLPGLINAHNHLFQVLIRGLGKRHALADWMRRLVYPVARELRAADYRTAALLACVESFRHGTTAIIELASHYARFQADETMQALREAGIRGAVARTASDVAVVAPDERRPPDEDRAEALAFLDRGQGTGIVQAWLGVSGFHSASPELVADMKALARDRGVRFHLHLGESEGGRRNARQHGHVGEVAWADSLHVLDAATSAAHGVWVNEAEVELLRRAGAQVVHNPSSNQVLASGVADVVRLRAAEVPVALGGDGPASNDSMDMFPEMKAAVLMQRVHRLDPTALSASDAFRLCTAGGAEVLGEPRLGRLETGCLADIVAVECRRNPGLTPLYDPIESLVYHGSGRDVVLTLVNGRIVYDRGAFPTVDVQRVLAEAEAIGDRIARTHPEATALWARGGPAPRAEAAR
jgi:5-methylthioadenosine/S-adenosylhomocysteine deaminase